ncbi:type 2 periplasmic-binding domain-containing protein [Rheinheimera sediminis]|uniref:phosphate ABC transporter substrate-binding protein n=1 Tax=Rheinheimera sp. YQF-1 TaxID=2499626 RepID=UPI001C96E054|nr:phosphate ABC transporter substrate-binding protein [Rheinheimera sp. YQF-1]
MNLSKLGITIFTLSLFSNPLYSQVAVIVHATNQQALTESDIKNLFTGKLKSFPDGNPVIVLNLPEGDPNQSLFNQKVLGRSDAQVKAFWSKLMFTGKGTPPKEVTAEEMIKLVSENPSTIGIVDSAAVSDKVRVLIQH